MSATKAGDFLTKEQRKKLAHLTEEQISRLQPDPAQWKPAKIRASRDIAIGTELETVTKQITQDKMRLYLGGPGHGGRHTDYEGAWDTGMPRPIIMANQIAEYWGEMMIKFFGTGYIGGTLAWTSIHVPFADDIYTCHMVVKEKKEEGKAMRIILDAWTERQQDGQKVLVGSVSGLVNGNKW